MRRFGVLAAFLTICALVTASSPASAQTATQLTTVSGQILDASPQRVLYLVGAGDLRIRDVASGQDTAITVPAGRSVASDQGNQARLVPGGAVFATEGDGGRQFHEWRNGTLTLLGPIGIVDRFAVAGDYVAWIYNQTITRRHVPTQTNVTVTTAADGDDYLDVAANGDVVFEDAAHEIQRWRNGVLTQMSTTGLSSKGATRPKTDGINVAFSRGSIGGVGWYAYNAGAGETELEGTRRTDGLDPRTGFALDGGWIAYASHLPGEREHVWTRSPEGVFARASADRESAANRVAILDLAPNGHVAYSLPEAGTSYLAAPGYASFPLGAGQTRAFWAEGSWYLIRQQTLYRVELDTAITLQPPAMTKSDDASFEIASTARNPVFECRLDGGSWGACGSTKSYENLADGAHLFEARTVGDPTPAQAGWLVDSTAPGLVVTGPAAGATVHTTDSVAKFAWEPATDAGSGVAFYRIFLDGTLLHQGNADLTRFDQAVTPGHHEWRIEAHDHLGNVADSGPRSFTMVVDQTAPGAAALQAPAAGAATADQTPSLSWQPGSDPSGVGRQRVWVDDAVVADLDGTATGFTAATLAEGPHTWSVETFDAAGNVQMSERRSFLVDTTPVAAKLSVSPSPALTGQPVVFDASGSSDATSTITGYEWDLDGDGSFETATGRGATTSRDYGAPGTRTVAVRVTDAAGNAGVASASLEIRPAATPGPGGVSIEGGARYTRSAKVTLTVRWPALATSVLVANDGGFTPAGSFPLAGEIPWELDTGADGRKTVYVRFPGAAGDTTYQDDIILDATAPRIRSAVLKGRRLRLRASDATSGLATVHVTRNRARPGKGRRFRGTLRVAGSPRWVRVTDHAGNRTRGHRIKRRR